MKNQCYGVKLEPPSKANFMEKVVRGEGRAVAGTESAPNIMWHRFGYFLGVRSEAVARSFWSTEQDLENKLIQSAEGKVVF